MFVCTTSINLRSFGRPKRARTHTHPIGSIFPLLLLLLLLLLPLVIAVDISAALDNSTHERDDIPSDLLGKLASNFTAGSPCLCPVLYLAFGVFCCD